MVAGFHPQVAGNKLRNINLYYTYKGKTFLFFKKRKLRLRKIMKKKKEKEVKIEYNGIETEDWKKDFIYLLSEMLKKILEKEKYDKPL